jgi:hypothetical protein
MAPDISGARAAACALMLLQSGHEVPRRPPVNTRSSPPGSIDRRPGDLSLTGDARATFLGAGPDGARVTYRPRRGEPVSGS